MNRNLIVPIAADKEEYNKSLPYVFALGNDGIIVCIKSIMGLDLGSFDKIYFTILKKHDEAYFVSDALSMQCRRLGINNIKIVVLDDATIDQVDTVYQTIKKEAIKGRVYIKDADCYFETKVTGEKSVAIYPIEELDILDPRNKSYVSIDDMYYITNIIEKSVVGRYISAGGYSFDDCDEFCTYVENLKEYGRLYLSNVVYSMLLDGKTFRPNMVKKYEDWGTKRMIKIK